MIDKRRWIVLIAVSVVLAIGSGVMIYLQSQKIEEMHREGSNLRTQIDSDRTLIKKTPDLVKEVIIQRETDAVIKSILSDDADVNNFVRTLQAFANDSGVTVSSVKLQRENRQDRGDEEFRRVGYTLSMDATAFELLAFLDRVETHSRFMSVTACKVTSARGNRFEAESEPRHKVQIDLETYVYAPKVGAKEVRIDQYERKRDLLLSEISRRTSELQVPVYTYRGPRGRRDPWVDPRVPVAGDDYLSVEEQMAIVEDLSSRAEAALELWEAVLVSENLINEMKARAKLEEHLARLEEDIRRVEADGSLSFLPASRRFDKNVIDTLALLRSRMESTEGARPGPSVAALREAGESMKRHIEAAEYELALEAYAALEPRLTMAERDPLKVPLVNALREMEAIAKTVIEFESITLEIGGIAIYEERRPVALINGEAVSEGEVLAHDLYVRNIRSNLIEFSFRGMVLARRFE